MEDLDDLDETFSSLTAEFGQLESSLNKVEEEDEDSFAEFNSYRKPVRVVAPPVQQTPSKPALKTSNPSLSSSRSTSGGSIGNRSPQSSQRSSGSGQNDERLINTIRLLNDQRNEARNRVQELEAQLSSSKNGDAYNNYKKIIDAKSAEIAKLKQENKYLYDEKVALAETIDDFTNVGFGNIQLQTQLEAQKVELDSLHRQVASLQAEKKILHEQTVKLQSDLVSSGSGSSGDTTKLKLLVRKLEADLESSNVKIRRLVGAIKADRSQSDKIVTELTAERDEQEMRAEKVEVKLMQLIELLRTERARHQEELENANGGGSNEQVLESAREALAQAEEQIKNANIAAQEADAALQVKTQEVQKLALLAKKKAREAQNAQEDIQNLEEKLDKLVEATKILKAENMKLKSGARGTRDSIQGDTDELELEKQKSSKLEAACRKLKQMLAEAKDEAAEKEKGFEERLQRAEQRAKLAEERAIAVSAVADAATSVVALGGPPPPPPPPPPAFKEYAIKIKRTGQSDKIIGPKGTAQTRERNVFVDSIVDAIRKGVSLKKTGLLEYDGVPTWESAKSAPKSPEDFLAEAAREIALNRQKGEMKRIIKAPEQQKKKGAELDSLLKELEDLEDLAS